MANEIAETIAAAFVETIGGPLRALRAINDRLGHVDGDAQAAVANLFNLSRADVRGILSFYEDLRDTPAAPTHIRVCQAEACQAVGSRDLTDRLERHFGVELHTSSTQTTLEPVYCLGLCAQGPALTVNGRPVARGDLLDLDSLGSS